MAYIPLVAKIMDANNIHNQIADYGVFLVAHATDEKIYDQYNLVNSGILDIPLALDVMDCSKLEDGCLLMMNNFFFSFSRKDSKLIQLDKNTIQSMFKI
ncbi:hypothetical protein [Alishewanella phage vB_AspM_Slicko01]|nr:hypothetical protein [Alishewanella phage vB_AspM_Slicko01]